mmetsp:Transcript_30757/g.80481  ORF Transcript_30757/g.80481 Transcript_30757/m.80481 type:complete len:116 (-) Transcript_30757:4107-4454(-)
MAEEKGRTQVEGGGFASCEWRKHGVTVTKMDDGKAKRACQHWAFFDCPASLDEHHEEQELLILDTWKVLSKFLYFLPRKYNFLLPSTRWTSRRQHRPAPPPNPPPRPIYFLYGPK